MPIKALNFIRIGSSAGEIIRHKPGTILELEEKEESRLIALKVAEALPTVVKEVSGVSNSGSQGDGSGEDPEHISPEEYERLHNLLDSAFNKEPLIAVAQEVGVELTAEAIKLKDNVIEEIILQGKDQEVLAKKEVE